MGALPNKNDSFSAIVEARTSPDMLEAIKDGSLSDGIVYTPYLYAELKDSNSCIINSGFYDNRKLIGSVAGDQKFVLLYKENNNTSFIATVANHQYSVKDSWYNPSGIPLLTFNSAYAEECETMPGYKYIVASVKSDFDLSEKDF
jgi:hypothetical protein